MSPGRSGALLAAAWLLSACARLPVGTDGLSFDERRRTLEAVSAWQMRGRLAADTGERAFPGGFDWRQDAAVLDLNIRGPLGQGILRVTGPVGALTLTARGETRTLADPETELSKLVGWWLPVASLPAWLLGLPDRSFPAVTAMGVDGTLTSLEQRLWKISYVSYQLALPSATQAGVLVPRRIDLTHGELKLRLTIESWQPAPPTTLP